MTHRPSSRRRLAPALAVCALSAAVLTSPAQAASLGGTAAPLHGQVVAAAPADATSPSASPTPGELKSTSDPADVERSVSQDTSAASSMWWLITGVGAIALAAMIFMMRRRRGPRQ